MVCVGRVGAGVGVLLLAVWAGLATPTSPPTPDIKTEAPPPHPETLLLPQDCQLYVMGELHGFKKHGDTWLNDGSTCETCSCFHGQVRCYYHYCNAGLTEGFTRPSSEPPPPDDEDGQAQEEGSGRPPWSWPWPAPDDLYSLLDDGNAAEPGKEEEEEVDVRENDTRAPADSTFCSPPCRKSCPTGFKVDLERGCYRCKCHKCGSMRGCRLQCPGGLALDLRGCRTCRCHSPKLAIFTATQDNDFIMDDFMVDDASSSSGGYVTSRDDPPCNTSRGMGVCSDGERVYPVGRRWRRGPCVSCSCVAPGYKECNVTQCEPTASCRQHQPELTSLPDDGQPCCLPCTDIAAQGETSQDPQPDGQNTSGVLFEHVPVTHSHNQASSTSGDLSLQPSVSTGATDGMTKSAVQASPIEWSQLCLIIIPLVLLFLLVAALSLHYWRRYHRDKYDINAYRPAETEKLRPVKTADDHLHVRHV